MALAGLLATFCICSCFLSAQLAVAANDQQALNEISNPYPLYVIADKPATSALSARAPKHWKNNKLMLRTTVNTANQNVHYQQLIDANSDDAEQVIMYRDDVDSDDGDTNFIGHSGHDYFHQASKLQQPIGVKSVARTTKSAVKDGSERRRRPTVGHPARRKQHKEPSTPPQAIVGSNKTSVRRLGGQHHGRGTKTSARQPVQATVPILPDFADSVDSSITQVSRGHTNHRQSQAVSKQKKLVCYYGTWAVYRPDAGKFSVENIDPFLCTHVIYGFTGLSFDNQIKPLDPWNDLEDNYGKGAMKRFTNLKRINPNLKTLVAIGGWNEGSIKYSRMADDAQSRARFARSVVDFLSKYNFDGLDLDWEYPGSRGGSSADKENFVSLLRELKDAFRPHNYLLTAAVSAGKWFIDPAYNIREVSKLLDLINLMTYDYHGGWESYTGHNAPLFSSPRFDKKPEDAQLNVNWSVNYWLANGAPASKIMLGVGSYGRSFTLDKSTNNGFNAPASQKGQAGPYTREPGSLGYNELCESMQQDPKRWTVVRDPDYAVPYAYSNRQWVGYDDAHSLALKAQFARSMGLGGVMMWSIETDDFQGRCHNEKFPLLKTIKRVLAGGSGRPEGTGSSTTTPTPNPESTSRPPVAGSTRPPVGTSTRPPAATSTRRPPTTALPTTTESNLEVEDETPKPTSTTRRPTRRPSRRPTTTRAPKPTSTTSLPIAPSTSTTVTPTPRPPVKPQPQRPFQCSNDGMFGDPRNCRKFIRCVSAGAGFSQYHFDCPPGTAFNTAAGHCDHLYNVPHCVSGGHSPVNEYNQSTSMLLQPVPLYGWF